MTPLPHVIKKMAECMVITNHIFSKQLGGKINCRYLVSTVFLPTCAQVTSTPPLILSSAFCHLGGGGGGLHMHIWDGYVIGKLSNIDTLLIDLASFNTSCQKCSKYSNGLVVFNKQLLFYSTQNFQMFFNFLGTMFGAMLDMLTDR